MIDKDRLWLFSMKLFSNTCHQKSDRSFFLSNYQFPICARCTGLLIGYILGIILLFFHLNLSVFLSLIFMTIMFIDWFLQYKKIYPSSNFRRLLTGFICGLGIIGILTNVYIKLIKLF